MCQKIVTLLIIIHFSVKIAHDNPYIPYIINPMKEDNSIRINTLVSAGFEEPEALIYELLLQSGELRAGEIIKKTALKRGNVYNILKSLVSSGFIEEFEVNGVNHYRPLHPSKIAVTFDRKAEEIEQRRGVFENVLPDFVSLYKLNRYKPTIRYFEGEDGVQRAIDDMLVSTETIYTYADVGAVQKYIADINKKHVEKRKKLGIKKKVLLFDTKESRTMFASMNSDEYTEFRVLKNKEADTLIEAALEIYDDKVEYLTVSNTAKIAVILQDARIAQMHRILFENDWSMSIPLEDCLHAPLSGDETSS